MGPAAVDNLGDSNYSVIQVTISNHPSLFCQVFKEQATKTSIGMMCGPALKFLLNILLYVP